MDGMFCRHPTTASWHSCSGHLATAKRRPRLLRLRNSSESGTQGAAAAAAAGAAAAAAAAAGGGGGGTAAGGNKAAEKLPLQQRILNGVLNVSNVPYSSFVPYPVTPLHRVDAQIKQLWLVALYLIIARASPLLRLGIAGVIAGLTMLCLPPRLWRSQLLRLLVICGLIFTFTALGADGVPPILQARSAPELLPAGAAALPGLQPDSPYTYVYLNLGFITITRRSINLALTAAALTFCALQGASLVLVTTPGEEMAVGLSRWLAPLRVLGVPTQRIAFTLLLSLRFMSLVFEEVRNLCLGLAARGIDWRAQGARGSLEVAGRLTTRLFGNLFSRSEKIAQAMVVRGFLGPQQHHLYMMRSNETTWWANVLAMAALAGLVVLVRAA